MFAIALVLTAGAQVLGIPLPSECSEVAGGGLTAECQAGLAAPVFLKAALGALVAHLLHAVRKSGPTAGLKVA